jgi:hypothetical protein
MRRRGVRPTLTSNATSTVRHTVGATSGLTLVVRSIRKGRSNDTALVLRKLTGRHAECCPSAGIFRQNTAAVYDRRRQVGAIDIPVTLAGTVRGDNRRNPSVSGNSGTNSRTKPRPTSDNNVQDFTRLCALFLLKPRTRASRDSHRMSLHRGERIRKEDSRNSSPVVRTCDGTTLRNRRPHPGDAAERTGPASNRPRTPV